MTTGLEYERIEREREALRVLSRSVHQGPHDHSSFSLRERSTLWLS